MLHVAATEGELISSE